MQRTLNAVFSAARDKHFLKFLFELLAEVGKGKREFLGIWFALVFAVSAEPLHEASCGSGNDGGIKRVVSEVFAIFFRQFF